ncbi:MAG: CmcJ/NvfI family oxidoreductase [Rhodospirillales bacterium]
MATALDRTARTAVRAPLQFAVKTGEIPVALVSAPGSGPDRSSGTFEWRDVDILDGRPIAAGLDLDRHGFLLREEPTAVKDFYDEVEVRNVYYPEMAALVQRLTGAEKVVVFDHTIRLDDPESQAARKTRAPVKNVHNDFTVNSAPQRVRDLLGPEEAAMRLGRRYGSINVWRPIRGPVETAPLAICGWDSLAESDLIASERRYQDRIGGVYQLAHNPAQRWYYFPRMAREEVVILKCFDSRADGTARWTAHGSFKDPTSAPGAAPRESIEIRTMYFFA